MSVSSCPRRTRRVVSLVLGTGLLYAVYETFRIAKSSSRTSINALIISVSHAHTARPSSKQRSACHSNSLGGPTPAPCVWVDGHVVGVADDGGPATRQFACETRMSSILLLLFYSDRWATAVLCTSLPPLPVTIQIKLFFARLLTSTLFPFLLSKVKLGGAGAGDAPNLCYAPQSDWSKATACSRCCQLCCDSRCRSILSSPKMASGRYYTLRCDA